MKKYLSFLLSLTVLLVCAKTVIMKIEMKDGTVRYVDTETVDRFQITQLDEIPDNPISHEITETMTTEGAWYHGSMFGETDRAVTVTDTYVANEPADHVYKVSGWGKNCKPVVIKGQNQDTFISLEVPCQTTGYIDPDYGEIWIADAHNYNAEVLGVEKYDQSFFDDNVFTLSLVYYAPNYEDGKTYRVQAKEYIVTDKFSPELNLDISTVRVGKEIVSTVKLSTEHPEVIKTVKAYWYTYGHDSSTDYDYDELMRKVETEGKEFTVSDIPTEAFTLRPDSLNCYLYFLYIAYDKDGQSMGVKAKNETLLFPDGHLSSKSGTYYFTGIFITDARYDMETRYLSTDSTTQAVYTIRECPNYGINLDIIADDIYKKDADGNIPVYIRETPTGYTETLKGDTLDICVASQHIFREAHGQQYENHSYYSPEKGLFCLDNAYYLKDTTLWFGASYEYFILDGFDNPFVAGITPVINNSVTDDNGTTTVDVSFKVNAKSGLYCKAIITDKSAEEAVSYIVDNASGLPTYYCNDNPRATLTTDMAGELNLVTVLFDAHDKAIANGCTSFRVKDLSEWTYLGKAEFLDGWIGVGLRYSPTPYQVDLYKSTNDSTLYALDKPWGVEGCPVLSKNQTPGKANVLIQFNIYDGPVFVKPQKSGFSLEDYGELSVGNYEGCLLEKNPDVSLQAIYDYITSKGKGLSVFSDGIVEIPLPFFGFNDDFGYSWGNVEPVTIVFPEGVAGQNAEAKSASALKASATVKRPVPLTFDVQDTPVRAVTIPKSPVSL